MDEADFSPATGTSNQVGFTGPPVKIPANSGGLARISSPGGGQTQYDILGYCELLRRPLGSWSGYIKCYIRQIDTRVDRGHTL